MKVYILNHFSGGTPMDSYAMGVYTTKEKALEEFTKSFETFGYDKNDERIEIEHTKENKQLSDNEQINVISTWFIDDEDYSFWGGCEIQVIELS